MKNYLRQVVPGPWQTVREVLARGGVGGMFEGLAPTLLREMPGYFVFFGTYEGVKVALPPCECLVTNFFIESTVREIYKRLILSYSKSDIFQNTFSMFSNL